MAAQKQHHPEIETQQNLVEKDYNFTDKAPPQNPDKDSNFSLSTFWGISFSVFLALLPKNSVKLLPNLQTQIKDLSFRLFQAEEQLKQMRSRRKEDSKANARVVEIFASHRNTWQAEERRLMQQVDAASEEIAHLRAKVADFERVEAEFKARIEELEREVGERDEMIGFMSRRSEFEDGGGVGGYGEEDEGEEEDDDEDEEQEERLNMEEIDANVNGVAGFEFGGQHPQQFQFLHHPLGNGFNAEFLAASASKFWAEKPSLWQDVQHESVESLYQTKHFVMRRESPWRVDGESSGVASKLKLLEQELLNLEKVGKTDISKVPSLMRKQVKKYQALAGKIDDLCRRMQESDPSDPTFSSEFRTQRQTEFLLEACRLQQRAAETGQKLTAVQAEIGKSYYREDLSSPAKQTTRRSMDSIRNKLKDIQRNLEIWLARIIGDLEGILARDGASRVREYYVPRYPFVQ